MIPFGALIKVKIDNTNNNETGHDSQDSAPLNERHSLSQKENTEKEELRSFSFVTELFRLPEESRENHDWTS